MGPAVGSPLWLLAFCFLAAYSSAQYSETSQVATKETAFLASPELCSGPEASDPGCPHRKKAVTLLPSFTKTTAAPTTHHPTTTHHPVTNHTTAHPSNHTTLRPTNHTTLRPTNHTTLRPTNHTTLRPTNHTTLRPTNHTTLRPTNHTTPPAVHTTPHPHTPQPTQPPFASVGNYKVPKGSPPCLWVQAGLELRVRYASKAKMQLWGTFALNPNRTEFSGNCTNHTATLHLHFPEGYLFFTFRKNETRNTFYLSRMQANLTYLFHQATERSFGADNSSLHEFEAGLGHSYQCRNRTLVLEEGFHLSALQERVQAFDLLSGGFGEAEVCPEQRRTPLLPIIIGVLLLVLILIVVVAFLIGRARSHRGYQTI